MLTRTRKVERKVSKHGAVRFFTDEMLHHVEQMAMMGATDAQLAVFFQVHDKTIALWKKNYPDFNEARARGGMNADMQVVRSLFKRANGFHYKEDRIFRVGTKLVTKKINVFAMPDTKACMYWLSNRQRGQWTNAAAKVTHEGIVKHEHTKLEDLPVTDLSKEARKMLFEVMDKQLDEGVRDN